jgi:hypothetical protein
LTFCNGILFDEDARDQPRFCPSWMPHLKEQFFQRNLPLTDFWLKCIWITFEGVFNCTTTLILVLEIVVTILAIAVCAKLSISKAITVEFKTLTFSAIAVLFVSASFFSKKSGYEP